jgi:hypothetical protein
VLFAPPGATAPDMDVTVHYIFNGFYAATVDNAGQQQSARQDERVLLPRRRVRHSPHPTPTVAVLGLPQVVVCHGRS